MSEEAAWVVVLVLTVLVAIPVVQVARGVFRHLRPADAAIVAEADADGRFRLQIPPSPEPLTVYVRFVVAEATFDPDDAPSLACGARFEPRAPHRPTLAVEWAQGHRAPRLDYAAPQPLGSVEARTAFGGSFFLLEVPPGGGQLEGAIGVADGLLRRAWVYVVEV